MNRHDLLIRYLMRKYGLTREEAEGFLDYALRQDEKVAIKSPRIVAYYGKRKQVGTVSSESDDDFVDLLTMSLAVAGMAFAGLCLLFDWLSKSRKMKKKEREEWLI